MKQIPFSAILILAFCFAVSAQTDTSVNNLSEPKLIAEINYKDSNEWHKLTIDLIKIELFNNPSAMGLIRIRNDKNLQQRLKLLKKAMMFQKADLSRITLLIVDEQKSDTNVLIALNCNEMPKCENCIVIRAIDIDKIEKLFKPKTTVKRKRK